MELLNYRIRDNHCCAHHSASYRHLAMCRESPSHRQGTSSDTCAGRSFSTPCDILCCGHHSHWPCASEDAPSTLHSHRNKCPCCCTGLLMCSRPCTRPACSQSCRSSVRLDCDPSSGGLSKRGCRSILPGMRNEYSHTYQHKKGASSATSSDWHTVHPSGMVSCPTPGTSTRTAAGHAVPSVVFYTSWADYR